MNYETYYSKRLHIKCGVPQGSILGPLLFIIYVNDLCNVSEVLKFIMFADDTNVFFSNKEARVIETVINTELKQNGDMV